MTAKTCMNKIVTRICKNKTTEREGGGVYLNPQKYKSIVSE